jgi:hypothetical protein
VGLARLVTAAGLGGCALLIAFAAPASAAVSFAPHADFGANSYPTSIATGDLNGDGKLDLATANQLSNDVSVLLNTAASGASAPTFATHADFAAHTAPVSVAIGDLNGDGKPDLAVANCGATPCDGSSPGDVSVLLNTTLTDAATPGSRRRPTSPPTPLLRVHFVLRGFRYRGHRVSQTLALDSGDTTIAGRTTRTAKLTVSAANLKLVQQLGSLYSRLALTVRNDAGDSRKSAATFELQP